MSAPSWWPRSGLWRHADFLRLWAAQIVSAFGSRITRTALPFLAVSVLHERDSVVGLLAALQVAPGVVLASVSGGTVDRSQKRRLLVIADLVRAALVVSLPIAWWLGHLTVAHLIVVGAGVGAASALFQITDTAYLPALVPKDDIVDGNSKLEATEATAEITGPAAAGALIGLLGAPLAVLIDAASYLWSAAFLGSIRARETFTATDAPRDVRADLRLGLRTVFAHPVIRAITLAQMLWYFSAGFFMALYSVFCLRVLALGPSTYGVVIGFGGVGALLGALIARRLTGHFGLGRTLIAACAIAVVAGLCIPAARGPAPLIIALLVAHQLVGDGAMVVFSIHAVSLRQTLLPTDVLGRANAAIYVVCGGMVPIGAVVAGVLADQLGTRSALWIGLGIGLAAPLFLWSLRGLVHARDASPTADVGAPTGEIAGA